MTCLSSRKRINQTDRPGTRAYVMLRSGKTCRRRAARILERQAGVVAVDLVEGPPDIVFVIEAPDRQKLASVLVNAMTSVENMTDGIELLPTSIPRRTNREHSKNSH